MPAMLRMRPEEVAHFRTPCGRALGTARSAWRGLGLVPRRIQICAATGLLLVAVVSGAETEVTPAQVQVWVRQLNSDQFVERELATEKLIAAGAAAVEPLAEALAGNNLEVTTRGIYILQELALSPQAETETAARAALERAAAPRFTSAARRAAEALTKLDTIRQERTLEEFKRLGAVVGGQVNDFGLPIVHRSSLEVGDKWKGSQQDLARLRWLRDIDELIFTGPGITDGCLPYVAEMKGLAALTLKHANITDEGLKKVKGIRGLQSLSVLYIPITDQAIDVFREVPGLRSVRLYGTRVTVDGAERLEQTLNARVDYQNGGFLGIAADPTRERCVVDRVGHGTPAEKAGLQVEDLIYEYEGKPVTNFDSFRTLVAKCRPGDVVTLKLIRGGEKLEKKVTLGERE